MTTDPIPYHVKIDLLFECRGVPVDLAILLWYDQEKNPHRFSAHGTLYVRCQNICSQLMRRRQTVKFATIITYLLKKLDEVMDPYAVYRYSL